MVGHFVNPSFVFIHIAGSTGIFNIFSGIPLPDSRLSLGIGNRNLQSKTRPSGPGALIWGWLRMQALGPGRGGFPQA